MMLKRFFVWPSVSILVVCFASKILPADQDVPDRLEKLETEVKSLKYELELEKAKEADRDIKLNYELPELHQLCR